MHIVERSYQNLVELQLGVELDPKFSIKVSLSNATLIYKSDSDLDLHFVFGIFLDVGLL